MTIKIVTNNPSIRQELQADSFELDIIQGHAKDVISRCESLILEGWRLAVDPLAGHYIRRNPYHTIVLLPNQTGSPSGEDLVRLMKAAEPWERQGKYQDLKEELKKDFMAIDCSLAVNVIRSIQRT